MRASPAATDSSDAGLRAPAVLKFGGSSFRTLASYAQLAEDLSRRVEEENTHLVVVVSGQPGETEQFRERLSQVNPHPEDETVAGLLTLADTVGAQLLATALHRRGRTATVLAGHQLGLTTDSSFMWARLEHTDPEPLRTAVRDNEVVVIPGGQAADKEGRPTWLGKNSSDLSAVAVAAAVGAARCEIHSDVDGIYSCDPHLVSGSKLLSQVSYNTAALMSLYGAKVLHRRAVRLAQRHKIEIVCRYNRAPFPTGSVIGTAGSTVAAVVLNQRSAALRYETDDLADQAYKVFHGANIDVVRLTSGPLVAVTGGFVDLPEFQRRHGLTPGEYAGVPLTAVRGSQVVTQLAADEEDALHVAQRLHDHVNRPGTDVGPQAPLPELMELLEMQGA
ncbi:amino acid kinase family protein [Streptomyces tsukubensis]|uniref:aspartate kinase n=1 Tax=Streptomyces tsukubensis TaxID=83656 RepID=A0A1V4ABA5_9ACTN|nr:aspartate kinase [Streptomyces tsukubensis]OON81126.1 aspartate kinase [Streptomyces tsukubensis]